MPSFLEFSHPLRNLHEHLPFAPKFNCLNLHRRFDALLCLAILINVCEAKAQLRLVGTNLIDFRPISQSIHAVALTNSYRIMGTVGQVTEYGVLIQRFLGSHYERRIQSDLAPRLYGAGGALSVAAAGRMGDKITYGQFISLSPQMQMHYQPVQRSETILLTNCPAALAVLKEKIDVFAMPAGKFTYESIGEGMITVNRYDLGVSVTNLNPHPGFYFQVRTNGIFLIKAGKHSGKQVGQQIEAR